MKPDLTSNADAALDREIEAIIGVDPPPEFVSRVRTHIVKTPAPFPFRVGPFRVEWMAIAAGTMAAAIVVACVIDRPHDSTRVGTSGPLTATSMLTTTPAENSPQVPTPVSPAITPTVHMQKVAKHGSGEPEMLISPRETAALHRLLTEAPTRWVEISVMTIDPQPLPETAVTSIPIFDPMATSKGDLQ